MRAESGLSFALLLQETLDSESTGTVGKPVVCFDH